MSILNKLATSRGRRDEVPNTELAKEIVKNEDSNAVKELIENLQNKDKNIQADCIKVLYEAGERNPKLISKYYNVFLELLKHKNNRLAWGGMCALASVSEVIPGEMFENLNLILDAMEKGTVITNDGGIKIIATIGAHKKYNEDCLFLLMEQLQKAPLNQFPAYSEKIAEIMSKKHVEEFIKILNDRLETIDMESKRKRILKVIAKVKKLMQ